jgi:predicted RNase H-like HicB family nuclease
VELPPLTSVVERGEDGGFVATCPELGIFSQGETAEDAEVMIKEAVELWLECATALQIKERLERQISVKPLRLSHA